MAYNISYTYNLSLLLGRRSNWLRDTLTAINKTAAILIFYAYISAIVCFTLDSYDKWIGVVRGVELKCGDSVLVGFN